MGREVQWLQAHVLRCLEEVWDVHRVDVDCDGDVPFRAGAAGGWVSVIEDDPLLVRVWAHAAYGLKATAAVLREINDVNRRTKSAHVYWGDGVVVVEQAMHADGVDTATLAQAWRAVCGVANDIGPLLAAVYGGATPFPAVEESTDNSEAG